MDPAAALKALNVVAKLAFPAYKLAKPEAGLVIDSIGGAQAAAAKRVLLEDMPNSQQPERQIHEAVAHFNSAIELFSVTEEKFSKGVPSLFCGQRLLDIRYRSQLAHLAVSLCYHALSESVLARDYLRKAVRRFYKYAEPLALAGDGEVLDRGKHRLQEAESHLIEIGSTVGYKAWQPTCVFEEIQKEFETTMPNGERYVQELPVTRLKVQWNPPNL